MKKRELRKKYQHLRYELSGSEITDLENRICKRFLESVDLSGLNTLHYFMPIKEKCEFDVLRLVGLIQDRAPGLLRVVPRTGPRPGYLEHVIVTSETKFAEAGFGISEPIGGETVFPDRLDMVLVPLLCFDRSGHRVGYGGGYYDRFLASCRYDCRKIGLSHFDPVEDIADLDHHDVRLDMCVTPERMYDFAPGSG